MNFLSLTHSLIFQEATMKSEKGRIEFLWRDKVSVAGSKHVVMWDRSFLWAEDYFQAIYGLVRREESRYLSLAEKVSSCHYWNFINFNGAGYRSSNTLNSYWSGARSGSRPGRFLAHFLSSSLHASGKYLNQATAVSFHVFSSSSFTCHHTFLLHIV
jgi:hypothetical protein